ncbi:MAG: SDR family NAD(P)-dependent oxidoreductase [Pseudonocardiales bacterium]|nr:SDR family NAD(P)-dependent oxidoreductase [Pseudonocardiales bacterium]
MTQTPDTADPRDGGTGADGRRRLSRRSVLRLSALGAAAGAGGFTAGRVTAPGAVLPDWALADVPPQRGRRVVVTGGNRFPQDGRSGLGYHQALGLALAGADVTIASRDAERGAEAVRRIRDAAPAAAVRFESLDLADLRSVAAFAARMQDAGDGLDLLINNAGVMSRTTREVGVDGVERVFATNALGPFVLSARLRPLLQNGTDPRIVWMASLRGHGASIDLDDLQKEREWDYERAYDDTKLANLLFAAECQRRSTAAGWRITSVAAHPASRAPTSCWTGPGPTPPRDGASGSSPSCGRTPPRAPCRSSTPRPRRRPTGAATTARRASAGSAACRG